MLLNRRVALLEDSNSGMLILDRTHGLALVWVSGSALWIFINLMGVAPPANGDEEFPRLKCPPEPQTLGAIVDNLGYFCASKPAWTLLATTRTSWNLLTPSRWCSICPADLVICSGSFRWRAFQREECNLEAASRLRPRSAWNEGRQTAEGRRGRSGTAPKAGSMKE